MDTNELEEIKNLVNRVEKQNRIYQDDSRIAWKNITSAIHFSSVVLIVIAITLLYK